MQTLNKLRVLLRTYSYQTYALLHLFLYDASKTHGYCICVRYVFIYISDI